MKKVFTLFSLLGFLLLVFVSCGENETKPKPSEPSDTEAVDTDTEPEDTGSASECGNRIVEEGEICDGGAQECAALNPSYTSGYATCMADCSGWDESDCTGNDTPDSDSNDTAPDTTPDSDTDSGDTAPETVQNLRTDRR